MGGGLLLSSVISDFKKIIKNYSLENKKLLLQSYKNKLDILSETQQLPLVVACKGMEIPNIEYKLDKSKQVIAP